MAEVFVSKADLVWGVEAANAFEGRESCFRTSVLEKKSLIVGSASSRDHSASSIAREAVFHELFI